MPDVVKKVVLAYFGRARVNTKVEDAIPCFAREREGILKTARQY